LFLGFPVAGSQVSIRANRSNQKNFRSAAGFIGIAAVAFMGLSVPKSEMFSTLPRWKTPWQEFVFSYGLQAVAITVLIWVRVLHPEILDRPARDYHAIELVPTPVPVNHEPQRQLPQRVLVAKLDPLPASLHLAAPTPLPKPKNEDVWAPEVKITERKPDPVPIPAAPAIPKQIVRMNLFSTGSSAPQTTERAPQQVQTGGFGDPNGVPGKGNPTRAVNIAQAGGFDMPTGPGNGNGTGGANGARGVVASTGFGGGVAVPANPAPARRSVQQSGFGDADVPAPPTVQSRPATSAARIIPAEILSKPNPVYTDEARAKRVEGEVLLEVVFGASGRIQVLRVIRGLGYGLDDAAVRAAQQIRFKPALQDGQPSDSTAVLHIIFQLA
jgi:TonB family protein